MRRFHRVVLADACGPEAVLACGKVEAMLNLTQWDYAGPVQGFRDGEVVDLGEHKLRFLETPHVHYWDSMMMFEETTGSLFPADLYIQMGDQPPVVRENLGEVMCGFYKEVGIFAAEEPVRRVVNRIEKLDAQWAHPMHGGSLPRDVIPDYTCALKNETFAFEGKVFGRTMPEQPRACEVPEPGFGELPTHLRSSPYSVALASSSALLQSVVAGVGFFEVAGK